MPEKDGYIVHFIGNEERVGIGNTNLTDAIIMHNHPESNGIISFGKDGFDLLKENPSVIIRLVNKEYDY